MPISDIKTLQRIDLTFNSRDKVFITNNPKDMPRGIVRFEIIFWFVAYDLLYEGIYRSLRFVGKKHRTHLRVERIHMIHPIVFFNGSSKLMFLNEIMIIGIHRGDCYKTNLLMIA